MAKPRWRVAGLMSGTSLDGIDVAVIEVGGAAPDAEVTMTSFRTIPYTAEERARLFALLDARTRDVCDGDGWLGERFAAALADVGPIDLIGSHGQTVWHQPPSQVSGGQTPSTLQLGEPAIIAARTGAITVGDFRVADIAVGGEGAPLVPWVDWRLFRASGRRRVLQNIGGIANATLVTEDFAQLRAFDNGPGNVMIDALAPAASDGADTIDRDGTWSARGVVQDDLLKALLVDPYLAQAPPKSTGRERYGRETGLSWAAQHGDRRAVDLLATMVAFTAHAIADSYRHFGSVDEVLVSGGGAHNQTLMKMIAARLGKSATVRAFHERGIDADAKEAVAFALLAVECVAGRAANVPHVSGARRPARLGKICFPPL